VFTTHDQIFSLITHGHLLSLLLLLLLLVLLLWSEVSYYVPYMYFFRNTSTVNLVNNIVFGASSCEVAIVLTLNKKINCWFLTNGDSFKQFLSTNEW